MRIQFTTTCFALLGTSHAHRKVERIRISRAPAFVLTAVILASSLATRPARAQMTVDQQAAALQLIRDTAKDLCASLPLVGKRSNVEVSADATAKLAGVLKKLSDLGVQASAKYQSTESQEALVQSDVLPALKDQTSCRLHVFDRLSDKLLSQSKALDVHLVVFKTRKVEVKLPSGTKYATAMRLTNGSMSVGNSIVLLLDNFSWPPGNVSLASGAHLAVFDLWVELASDVSGKFDSLEPFKVSCQAALKVSAPTEFVPVVKLDVSFPSARITDCGFVSSP